jgi:hypothetical protein
MIENIDFRFQDCLVDRLNQAIEEWRLGQVVPLPSWYQ